MWLMVYLCLAIALAENAKYLDSIQGRLDNLKGSFQTLSTDLINSDALKAGVSALTGIVNLVDKLASSLGSLGTVAAGAGLVALIKNFGNSNEFALYGCEPIAA